MVTALPPVEETYRKFVLYETKQVRGRLTCWDGWPLICSHLKCCVQLNGGGEDAVSVAVNSIISIGDVCVECYA